MVTTEVPIPPPILRYGLLRHSSQIDRRYNVHAGPKLAVAIFIRFWSALQRTIPSRPQDTVAVGFVYTHIGDLFQAAGVISPKPLPGTEKALELNYALWLKPCVLWQPVFQYYWDVGGNSRIPNAAVLGSRVKVDF